MTTTNCSTCGVDVITTTEVPFARCFKCREIDTRVISTPDIVLARIIGWTRLVKLTTVLSEEMAAGHAVAVKKGLI